ncbi:hypothetical protein QVD17_20783 [Tagetes erecta]|uniref:Uncharacterized protein n=1 Tax=Tagetes erecta TaxID=13708 RepID=A0AAD8NYI8_TARER|nr:hypothetical protein QVD17_20783 [Tagetes erecta]
MMHSTFSEHKSNIVHLYTHTPFLCSLLFSYIYIYITSHLLQSTLTYFYFTHCSHSSSEDPARLCSDLIFILAYSSDFRL